MDSKIWPSVRPSLSKSGQFPQTRCKLPSSLSIPSIELASGDIWGTWVWDHADGENLIIPTAAKATGNCIWRFLLVVVLTIHCLLSDILCFNEKENVSEMLEKKFILIHKRNWLSEYCIALYCIPVFFLFITEMIGHLKYYEPAVNTSMYLGQC